MPIYLNVSVLYISAINLGEMTLKKILKSLTAFFAISVILLSSVLPAFASANPQADGRPTLKFNSSGKFRIMMINDTQDTDKTIKDTLKLINNSLDKTKPDLVVLVGDNIAGRWLGVNKKQVAKAIDNIVKPINDRHIPFAVVFGNHDQESGISKEEQMKMYMSYKYCLAVDEGSSLSNCGTYNLLIKDSKGEKNVFNIWMVDSGTSAKGGGYQYVNEDQIEWYIKTSNELKKENGGKPLPSLWFQHIPVPEIYDLLNKVPKGAKGAIQGTRTMSANYYIVNPKMAKGKLLEGPCTPDKNSGEFAAWLKQGDVLGAYFGHDHVNDLKGTLDGIDLGYTPGAGFNQYGNGVYRGVRILDLSENDPTHYATEVKYYKDLVSPKADTTINDSFFVCELRYMIPIIIALFMALMFLLMIVIAVVKKIIREKKKRIPEKASASEEKTDEKILK